MMSSKRVSVACSLSSATKTPEADGQKTTGRQLKCYLQDLTLQSYEPTTDVRMARRLRMLYHKLGQTVGSLMPAKWQCRCLNGKCRGPVIDSSSDEDDAEEAIESLAQSRDGPSGEDAGHAQQSASAGCAQQDAQTVSIDTDDGQPPAKKQRADTSPAAAQMSKAVSGAAVPIVVGKLGPHKSSDQKMQDMQGHKPADAQTGGAASADKLSRLAEQRAHIRLLLQSLQDRSHIEASPSQPPDALAGFDTAAEILYMRQLCSRPLDAELPARATSEQQIGVYMRVLSALSRSSFVPRCITGFYLLSMQQQHRQQKEQLPRGMRSFHDYVMRRFPGFGKKQVILNHIKWFTMCRLWPEIIHVEARNWSEILDWMQGNMLEQEIRALMARQATEKKAQENSQRAVDTAAAHVHTVQQRMQAQAVAPKSIFDDLFGDEEAEADEVKANPGHIQPGPFMRAEAMCSRSPSPSVSSPAAAASDARLAAEEVEPMDESADDEPSAGMNASAVASATAADANAALEDGGAQRHTEAREGEKESEESEDSDRDAEAEEGEKESNEAEEAKEEGDAGEKGDVAGEQESSSHEDGASPEEDNAAATSPTAAAHGGKEQQSTNLKRRRGD